jgi:hypothetical protein
MMLLVLGLALAVQPGKQSPTFEFFRYLFPCSLPPLCRRESRGKKFWLRYRDLQERPMSSERSPSHSCSDKEKPPLLILPPNTLDASSNVIKCDATDAIATRPSRTDSCEGDAEITRKLMPCSNAISTCRSVSWPPLSFHTLSVASGRQRRSLLVRATAVFGAVPRKDMSCSRRIRKWRSENQAFVLPRRASRAQQKCLAQAAARKFVRQKKRAAIYARYL